VRGGERVQRDDGSDLFTIYSNDLRARSHDNLKGYFEKYVNEFYVLGAFLGGDAVCMDAKCGLLCYIHETDDICRSCVDLEKFLELIETRQLSEDKFLADAEWFDAIS
jgi:hypothetical protein